MSGLVDTTREIAKDVLAFLDLQRLPATPQNYTLAYLAKSGAHDAIRREVDSITDDGMRLTQEQADELFGLYAGGRADAGSVPAQDDGRAAVRYQMLRFAEITASAASATGDFNRDLSKGLDQLAGGPSDLIGIVAGMVQRSQATERELEATNQQVEMLRQELESVREDATTDSLTGLGNRRTIDARLARLAKAGTPRIIAICDVDRFKSINDRYGHAVGDRVLRTVAGALAEACSPHHVGRWGGEEFVVIMPAIKLDEGVAIVDAARHQLANRIFKLRETDEPLGPVTFSAGVSLAVGEAHSNAVALEAADKLLYEAKRAGRNRVLS